MKKTLLSSLLLTLLCSFFLVPQANAVQNSGSLAASSSASPSLQQRLENRRTADEERKEATKERIELRKENSEERQELRLESREQFLERVANRVERRFSLHVKRLENWIERASKRIATLSSEGKNTTAAQAALDKAKQSLATAKTLGTQAVALLRAVSVESWDAQKADATAARAAVTKAQVAFAQVVKDMQATIKELKALQES
ncbi:hypothetical protein KBD71_04235 [Candidatus Woesebacteria bacterium]|nr:hypothetical protein [Candidatus Woesebacteria bacterium]